jgi:hypothetical protein
MDFGYIEDTFKAGILDAFTAVSVHPYRAAPPDDALADFARLRALIVQYAPAGKADMPVYSGEWGYTSAQPPGCTYGNRANETDQGRYLARMWLANLISNASLSIGKLMVAHGV